MNKDRKGQFSVHCILCGKNFYADTKPDCGGTLNGKPMCKTGDIKRVIETRLQKNSEGETK